MSPRTNSLLAALAIIEPEWKSGKIQTVRNCFFNALSHTLYGTGNIEAKSLKQAPHALPCMPNLL